MRWRSKARIQATCAAIPGGPLLYRSLQQRFGTLAPDPFGRLAAHVHMLRGLTALDVGVVGARCLEVGTGHVPVVPVGFFLSGASEVVSVDLHRRLDLGLTSRMLERLAAERDRVVALYSGLVEPAALRRRLDVLARGAGSPADLFADIGLRYDAPGDAAALPHRDGSVDVHFSMTVLEHIEPVALAAVLSEARRVLAGGGAAVHFVDPSDHFSHQDPRIPPINFLRYSQAQWQRIAGNEFSYTNRLRASQLEQVFVDAGLRVERTTRRVDDRSLAELRSGFPLAPEFRGLDEQDLCTTTWRAYARPA